MTSAAPVLASLDVLGLRLRLHGDAAGFAPELAAVVVEPGLALVTLTLRSASPARVAPLRLSWEFASLDVQGIWRSDAGLAKTIPPNWASRGVEAKATSQAPVLTLFSQSGLNRLTVALSDALHPSTLAAAVVEENGMFACEAALFAAGRPALREIVVQLRLDRRALPYHDCLAEVAAWWAAQPGCQPSPVPEVGRRPMYSTWYSFHQALDVGRVLEQCRLAKARGCEAVIVDDGWQTLDGQRGYAWCGDWQPERIPDMAGFVREVHRLGMRFILWYSVPFIGARAANHARFAGKYLEHLDAFGASVLDPRFPDVREWISAGYERAMREWDLDGFKLDFVDSFRIGADSPREAVGGRDIADVDEAVDRLLSEVMARLRARRADVLIEFRQSYVGPRMRAYGNLFRAGDCPNDALGNRVRTLDVRLLCGDTAAHADMLMWHPDEPAESAALQLLNVLFAVPQISVLLDRVPAAHQQMLDFWLAWWIAHRDVLLDGHLAPHHPECQYPVVVASTAGKRVVAVYSDALAAPGRGIPAWLALVNGTRGGRLVLDLDEPLGRRRVEIRDCRGAVVSSVEQDLPAGAHRFAVPAAGLVTITAT